MSPDQAATELLTVFGDGAHIKKTLPQSTLEEYRYQADFRDIYRALIFFVEKLKDGVRNTEMCGWYPRFSEGHASFSLLWRGGSVLFLVTPSGVRYKVADSLNNQGSEFHPIPRMVGESIEDAAVRLVFNILKPVYEGQG